MDGSSALATYKANPPDLAVLDIGLPDIRGTELAARLLEHHYRPILILSSHADKDSVDQAIDSGVIGYLVKPVTAPQIIPSIETGLARFGEIKQRMAERFGNAGMDSAQLTSAMDRLSLGIMIIDTQHHIIHTNTSAGRLLASNSMLGNRCGRIIARSNTAQFRAMLDTILTNTDDALSGSVLLRDTATGDELQVWGTPLPASEPGSESSAVLVVNDPKQTPTEPGGLLKSLYGLTKKESSLARALYCGQSLDEYCENTFVTVNTARTHLKSIYRKTSTNRRADLVRLLSHLFVHLPLETP